MEIVSNTELAEYFQRLQESIELLGSKMGPQAAPMKEYFTRPEAADYLRIGMTKLDELTRSGDIRRAKMGDGPKALVLYRRKDLDAFVECRLETDKAEAKKRS